MSQSPLVGMSLMVYPRVNARSNAINLFINDLDDGAECNLSKFAGDATLRGVADTLEGHAANHRDINRLEKWPDNDLMNFTRRYVKSCTWGTTAPGMQMGWGLTT